MKSMGRAEKLFDAGVIVVLTVITVVIMLPMWYVVVTSVTPFDVFAKTNGTLFLNPAKITLEGYRQLFQAGQLPHAFLISLYITVVGTALNLIVTVLMAYPLAQKRFALRTPLLLLVLFTLLFNGGLVPTYLVVRNLHLLNSLWSLMLPNLVNAFNLLVMKSFFQNLPAEIEEAARVDGASEWQILIRIVLPLSKPIIAVIGLFYAVAHWNDFFDAILYLSDANKLPLQVVLRSILTAGNLAEYSDVNAQTVLPTDTLRMAAVVLTTIPILLVYPFLQRYFTAGVLLGSVKE
ncbi:MAG: carbohydrate ABC transporter permease [Thermomicrobia bacterium]|nr:carbohydrate ABC transporter permease [Thermomicrobia bacterium]